MGPPWGTRGLVGDVLHLHLEVLRDHPPGIHTRVDEQAVGLTVLEDRIPVVSAEARVDTPALGSDPGAADGGQAVELGEHGTV